jgi:hypothetical protein
MMNFLRSARRFFYPYLPSLGQTWHAKRRKGLQVRWEGDEVLECQREQDRIFQARLLGAMAGGVFWELGAGDGVTGSCTLNLEQVGGWRGCLWEPRPIPAARATRLRRNPVLSGGGQSWDRLLTVAPGPDLVCIRRPDEHSWWWEWIESGRIRPRWVIVENPQPDPQWQQRLAARRYRLRWFFHDDEYFWNPGR